MKYLISELYREPPKTPSGLDVGTLIFDPDGEYFWPDTVRARPGLCDVPHLRERLVVFTNRNPASPYYGSWKAGEVKLDIRDLPARDVIGIAVSSERQEQQNVLKLKGVRDDDWRSLVDLIYKDKLQATDEAVGALLGYSQQQIQNASAEIAAARSNMNNVVRLLHDPDSKLLSGAIHALQQGAIVVVDISLLSSSSGNMLAGLLLRRLFSHNQENFTGGQQIIPVIAVVEEAQSVLGRNLEESSPYVEWVKEGRKYELGAILITQQPGSMAAELLSQADNWFCFHLLSEGDAGTLGKYNAHFSSDILAHLIGEPIEGNCFMWSAPKQPFVLPVRVRSFEALYGKNIVKERSAPAVKDTKAAEVNKAISTSLDRLAAALKANLVAGKGKLFRLPVKLANGNDAVGLKTGQLFYLIQEVKTASDTQPENQLKRPLMAQILGRRQPGDRETPRCRLLCRFGGRVGGGWGCCSSI